jgi:hypothetical protein
LVLIGCIHNFLAAPAMFDAIGADLFWFLSAGLALWYAGAANIVRQATAARAATIAAILVNLALLAFVTAFGIHTGEIASPGGLPLVLLALMETCFSIAQAVRSQAATSETTHAA